jgi:hypothetical protein
MTRVALTSKSVSATPIVTDLAGDPDTTTRRR